MHTLSPLFGVHSFHLYLTQGLQLDPTHDPRAPQSPGPSMQDMFWMGQGQSGFMPGLVGPLPFHTGPMSFNQLNTGVPALMNNAAAFDPTGLNAMDPSALMQLEQLKAMLLELLVMYLMLGGPQNQQRGRDLGRMRSHGGSPRQTSWSPSQSSNSSSAPSGSSAANAPMNGVQSTSPSTASGQRALDWSARQMNPATGTGVNSNNGQSVSDHQGAWDNWCLAFVSTAYGRSVPELAAGSAIESFRKFAAAGKISNSRNIPAGAPVFFQATSANGGHGHIAIATGKTTPSGDPIIRTSGWPGRSGIWEVPLSQLERMSGGYLGYGHVNQ